MINCRHLFSMFLPNRHPFASTAFLIMLFSMTLNAASSLDPDGMGWEKIRLGASYIDVKEVLMSEGWTLSYNFGESRKEVAMYDRHFRAKPPAKRPSAVQVCTVFAEKWDGKIYELIIELQGIDGIGIRSKLTQFFGQPEHEDIWASQNVKVIALIQGKNASLHFFDLKTKDRITHQEQIDQGLEPGTPSEWGPMRYPTAEEAAWILRFFETVSQSLPPAPNGFRVVNQTETLAPNLISRVEGTRPIPSEYVLKLENPEILDTQRDGAAQNIETIQNSLEDKLKSELQPKVDALQKRASQAAAKGDMAAVEQIQEEMTRLMAKADALYKETESAAREKGLNNKAQDGYLSIRIAINQSEALGFKDKSIQNIGGRSAYFRELPADETLEESETTVLIGTWRDAPGAPQKIARWNPGISNLAGQNLVIKVRGNQTRARAYLESIQWEKLAGLLASEAR